MGDKNVATSSSRSTPTVLSHDFTQETEDFSISLTPTTTIGFTVYGKITHQGLLTANYISWKTLTVGIQNQNIEYCRNSLGWLVA